MLDTTGRDGASHGHARHDDGLSHDHGWARDKSGARGVHGPRAADLSGWRTPSCATHDDHLYG